jgi:hypothetical protein
LYVKENEAEGLFSTPIRVNGFEPEIITLSLMLPVIDKSLDKYHPSCSGLTLAILLEFSYY